MMTQAFEMAVAVSLILTALLIPFGGFLAFVIWLLRR